MAVPRAVIEEALRKCPLRARIAVEGIEPHPPNAVLVHGRVVEVIRGDASMRDQPITVCVDVLDPGYQPRPSGTLWRSQETMAAMKAFVASLVADEAGIYGVPYNALDFDETSAQVIAPEAEGDVSGASVFSQTVGAAGGDGAPGRSIAPIILVVFVVAGLAAWLALR